MAAVRVQNYLKRHKIGPLFESLMGQVIQDTPDDPIGYIIKVLQEMHKRQSKQLNSSLNGRASSPRLPSRSSTHSESFKGNEIRSNRLAASWSGGTVQQENRKQEKQLKTWSGNNSEAKKNKTWSGKEPEQQPPWNNDTRVLTHDFDELFQMQNGDVTNVRTSQQHSPEKYQGVRTWESQIRHSSSGQKVQFQPADGEELTQELQLGSKSSPTQASRDLSSQDSASPVRFGRAVKSSKQAAEEHRKELQALLMQDSTSEGHRQAVGKYSPEEQGTEILERMEDLKNEGVSDAQTSAGVKQDKLKRNGNKEVSVTICARCARIIGHSDENFSKAASSDFESSLFEDITNRKQGVDDIESTSDVSDRMNLKEHNTWSMTESKDEKTPRKKTMAAFKKSFDSFPRKKSQNTFEPSDNTDDDSTVETQRSSRSRKSNFDFSNSKRNVGWRLDENDSDESDNSEVNPKQRSARSQASDYMEGRAWMRNSGDNSDGDSAFT